MAQARVHVAPQTPAPWPPPGQGPRELGDPQAWGFSGGSGQWAPRPLEQEAGRGEGP